MTRHALVVLFLSTFSGCGSDSSSAPTDSTSTSTSSSSTSTSGGSSTSSGATASSSGSNGDASSTSSSSGSVATCSAIYCCNFDSGAAACAVDDANVKAQAIDPSWIVQGAMRLEVQGTQNVVNGLGLLLLPKTTTGKRVEIEFALRMETSATAGILRAKGNNGDAFAVIATGTDVAITDSGTKIVGSFPMGTVAKLAVFVDLSTNTYGASLNSGPAATRTMASAWTQLTELQFGITKTLGTSVVHYDDIKVDWK